MTKPPSALTIEICFPNRRHRERFLLVQKGGVLGILPGIIGLIQATETVKIILGKGRTLSGRLVVYNALDMSFRELKLQPNPVRPVIDKLIDYEEFLWHSPSKSSRGATAGKYERNHCSRTETVAR